MEKNLQNSPLQRYPVESEDAKYVSGLSTILVATIQEAKDRISQIEYIFCSQLYPHFTSKSRSLHKIYSEAKKAAEDNLKRQEADFLIQIEILKSEKQRFMEENQALKLEKEKFVNLVAHLPENVHELREVLNQKANEEPEGSEGRELQEKLLEIFEVSEEKANLFLSQQKSLEKKVDELKLELRQKSKEVEEGMELHNKLLQIIESNNSAITDKGKQLKEHEEKSNKLLAQLKTLEKKIDELKEELRDKTEELYKRKGIQENLIKKALCNDKGKELVQEQRWKEQEEERKVLLEKLKRFEGRADTLKEIELKTTELLAEKKKRRDVVAAYKSLKSQYNFLCTKFGLTTENMVPKNKFHEESHHTPLASPDLETKATDTSAVACVTSKQKNEVGFLQNFDDDKRGKLNQSAKSESPSSSGSPVVAEHNTNSGSLAGTKRPLSSWRATRSRQNQHGPDPHDDFLDTPLDNTRGNLSNKAMKEEQPHDLPAPAPKDMNFDSSDDETQDVNVDPGSKKQQIQVSRPNVVGYKYVEPVRKKAERENLKGVECKQCQKFYDAVLPDGGGEDGEGHNRNLRCEHHDGVSRHRYRYVPPMTPEGFWNIGFESEM